MDEAERVAKALIEFLRYQTQKRNVFCQALIGISQYDSKSIDTIVNEKTNKRGRPKKQIVLADGQWESNSNNGLEYKVRTSQLEVVQPHIHTLFLSYPGDDFGQFVKKYLLKVHSDVDANNEATKIRVQKSNVDYANYNINQSSTLRFVDYRHSSRVINFPQEMTYRKYYNAYKNFKTKQEYFDIINTPKKTLRNTMLAYEKMRKFYFQFSDSETSQKYLSTETTDYQSIKQATKE